MISSVTPFTLNSVISEPVDDERLYDLIVNYAGTPLDCRKPEKRHAIKLGSNLVNSFIVRADDDIYLYPKNGNTAVPYYSNTPVYLDDVTLKGLKHNIKKIMPSMVYSIVDEPEPGLLDYKTGVFHTGTND